MVTILCGTLLLMSNTSPSLLTIVQEGISLQILRLSAFWRMLDVTFPLSLISDSISFTIAASSGLLNSFTTLSSSY